MTGSLTSCIGYLTALTDFEISLNQFTNTIPSSIGYWTNLNYLYLNANFLSQSLPGTIVFLSNLIVLNIAHNYFSSSIPSLLFRKLTSLQLVLMWGNLFTGSIPSTLGNIRSVSDLDIGSNFFTSSIPSSIQYLTELTYLDLSSNSLAYSIPTAIFSLTRLRYLYLNKNKLTSSIPSAIGSLVQLQTVNVAHNLLRYSIPSTVGYLSKLQYVSLSSNSMTGPIPTTVTIHCTRLTTLFLDNNFFSSSVPSTVGFLRKLQFLYLWSNRFTNSIPTSIGYLTNLVNLELSVNSFSSSIPSSFRYLTLLQYLTLNDNRFTSSIPTVFGYLRKLQYLGLYNNYRMTSSIPSQLGYLQSLTSLYLSSCSFTSSLPSTVGYLTNLQHLEVNNNHLTSSLPTSVCKMKSLILLDVQNNRFNSSIPSCLGLKLTNLNFLSLERNSFSSSLPSTMGKLNQLLELNVNSNNLTSTIPIALADLQSLVLLDLANNRFTGVPPLSLCAVSTLVSIYLSNNSFSCAPWCQTDGPWIRNTNDLYCNTLTSNEVGGSTGSSDSKISASLPRCPGLQDVAIADLNDELGIVEALSRIISTAQLQLTVAIGSSAAPVIVEYPNAFEYRVSFFNFVLISGAVIVICQDSSCNQNHILYESNGLEALDVSIARPYFYIALKAVPGGQNYYLPFSYKFNVVVYYRSPSSWRFSNSPFELGTGSVERDNRSDSVYATGLCQQPWYGITCSRGMATGLSLRALGLKGSLPSSIGLLTGLTELVLASNTISGSVVSTLGNSHYLNTLDLSSNRLTGSISRSLSNLTNLVYLDLSYNRLSYSVPTFFQSMDNLLVIYLDGNRFGGEISNDLCNAVKERNMTLSVKSNPSLTCYQSACWIDHQRALVQFDETLIACNPTHAPTLQPTVVPTAKPSFSTKSDSSSKLTNTYLIALTTVVAMFVLIPVAAFLLYRFWYSSKARIKRLRLQRLADLPVHRALLGFDTEVNSIEDVARVVREGLDTIHETDYDGNTVLAIVLERKHRVVISKEIVCMLLEASLPFDPVTDEAIYDHQSGWFEAIQHEDDCVVDAVDLILEKYKHRVTDLANAIDSKCRKCLDIASPSCRNKILRRLFLHERYELYPGAPEHRSATSIVVFGTDHEHVLREESTSFSSSTHLNSTRQSHSRPELVSMVSLHHSPSLARSSASSVHSTNSTSCKSVALKFMSSREQFVREVDARVRYNLDVRYVMSISNSYDGDSTSDNDVAFRKDAKVKGYEDFPYCIVMEAGSLSLKSLIDKQHFAGLDWDMVRGVTKQIASALQHIHKRGVIHGDLKGDFYISSRWFDNVVGHRCVILRSVRQLCLFRKSHSVLF